MRLRCRAELAEEPSSVVVAADTYGSAPATPIGCVRAVAHARLPVWRSAPRSRLVELVPLLDVGQREDEAS